ncbi:BMP family ABC transporter substrate-binding protein [Planctomycetota bacterium]
MVAACLSDANSIGIVAGKPVEEVYRLVNAFIQGVKEMKEDAIVTTEFIDSWYDPEIAFRKAKDLIKNHKVDVLYAERDGVIEACRGTQPNGKKVYAIGNFKNHSDSDPDVVVTNVIWNMEPTVRYVIQRTQQETYEAENLGDWSRMYHGGSKLQPFPLEERWIDKIGKSNWDKICQREDQIIKGRFRVKINESPLHSK